MLPLSLSLSLSASLLLSVSSEIGIIAEMWEITLPHVHHIVHVMHNFHNISGDDDLFIVAIVRFNRAASS